MEALTTTRNLPTATVQAEWDQTLRRLREMCEVIDASAMVNEHEVAHITVRLTDQTNVEGIERIMFQNLLFMPWSRTNHGDKIIFGGQWLWHWRRAVPWKAEKVGPMSRLVPGTPNDQWTYRFNVIEVEA